MASLNGRMALGLALLVMVGTASTADAQWTNGFFGGSGSGYASAHRGDVAAGALRGGPSYYYGGSYDGFYYGRGYVGPTVNYGGSSVRASAYPSYAGGPTSSYAPRYSGSGRSYTPGAWSRPYIPSAASEPASYPRAWVGVSLPH